MTTTFPSERIERSSLLLRGHKVLLDADLVATKRLNEQVRRNRSRFPEDFMFELTSEEVVSLRSQFATSNKGRGGRRYAPYAFTEQGVAMLSTVLNSERAIQVNIEIMRAFVRPFSPTSTSFFPPRSRHFPHTNTNTALESSPGMRDGVYLKGLFGDDIVVQTNKVNHESKAKKKGPRDRNAGGTADRGHSRH